MKVTEINKFVVDLKYQLLLNLYQSVNFCNSL
jgi:hypothetical protein